MALRKLERTAWRIFFDQIAVGLFGKQIEIEVASPTVGAQTLASWLPLVGMTYDPKSDVVEIVLDGLDHMVLHPRDVYIDGSPFGRVIIGIVDRDGGLEIIRLRDPLMLPAPQAH